MFCRRNSSKKAFLVIPAIILSLLCYSQEDSSGILTEEMDEAVVDTATEAIVEPSVTDEEGYAEETNTDGSKYFLKRTQQTSGGGPDSIQRRRLHDSLLSKLQRDDNFWYVNYPFEEPPETSKEKRGKDVPLAETPLFQTILWLAIIGGFAAFVIIYLSNSNVRLFRKRSHVISSEESGEANTDNIFEINYQKEIEKATGSANYRFAVRLMFLRLLRNLSEKNIIQYKPERTNFDYLLQLHPTKYYNDFFRITRNYEYSWYGLFDIDRDKFSLIKTDFDNFDNKLTY